MAYRALCRCTLNPIDLNFLVDEFCECSTVTCRGGSESAHLILFLSLSISLTRASGSTCISCLPSVVKNVCSSLPLFGGLPSLRFDWGYSYWSSSVLHTVIVGVGGSDEITWSLVSDTLLCGEGLVSCMRTFVAHCVGRSKPPTGQYMPYCPVVRAIFI